MSERPLDLTICVCDRVEDDELDQLTRRLKEEIAELDVEAVALAKGTELPPGAKGDPVTIGSLVVTLASAGVFTGLIELVKSWVLRREGRSVTLKAKVPEGEVELSYSQANTSPEEMTRFVNAIVGKLQRGNKSPAKE